MFSRLMQGLFLSFSLVVFLSGCGSSSTPGEVTANIEGSSETDSAGTGSQTTSTGTATKASTAQSAPAGDPLHPIVEIQTSLGKITLELDGENAPGTVRNFLNYVNSEAYNQTVIHYVDAGGMVLAGGFDPNLEPISVSPPIRNEAHNGLKNLAGTIAMSRPFDSIDGATSQFFINLQDNPALDHKGPTEDEYGYCVFGKVTSGLDVAEKISQVPVTTEGDFTNTPKDRLVIQAVRFVR